MTAGRRPVLGVLASSATGARVRPLLRALTAHAEVRALRPGVAVDAVLATSPAALAGRLVGDLPLALWLDSGAELAATAEVPHHVRVALSGRADVVDALGERAVLVPAEGVEADRLLPVPSHVRRRRRQLLGLPDDLVFTLAGSADHSGPAGSAAATVPVTAPALGSPAVSGRADDIAATSTLLDDDLVLLALAAAADVDGPGLVLALALGTPTVTSLATAEALGARHDREVVIVEDPAAASRTATALAADDRRAARLGAAGRRLVERRLDLGAVAAEVARRLGLAAEAISAVDRLVRRLDDLGTPPGAPIRWRAATMGASLAAPGATK